jgi:exodeoxyribonuclease-3
VLTVATWNVNSVKARLPLVTGWLASARPDVLLMQEIKTQTEDFPAEAFRNLGYEVAVSGQKSYNGVAIASLRPLSEVKAGLPGDEGDPQARWIEASLPDGLRLACLYLPNGNPPDSGKYPYKLSWMDRLIHRAREMLAEGRPFLLGGDFNVIPADEDVFDPKAFAGDALALPETRKRWRTLLNLGLAEAFRARHPEARGAWTFWDYQAGAWPRDQGLRIDHMLLSPALADRLADCGIDRAPRGAEKASDHTPFWCRFREEAA